MKIEQVKKAIELQGKIDAMLLRIDMLKEAVHHLENLDLLKSVSFNTLFRATVPMEEGKYLPAYEKYNSHISGTHVTDRAKCESGNVSAVRNLNIKAPWSKPGTPWSQLNDNLSQMLVAAHIEVYNKEIEHQQSLIDDMIAEIEAI